MELSVPEETRKERFAAEFRANLEAFIAALELVVAGEYRRKQGARSRMQNARRDRDRV